MHVVCLHGVSQQTPAGCGELRRIVGGSNRRVQFTPCRALSRCIPDMVAQGVHHHVAFLLLVGPAWMDAELFISVARMFEISKNLCPVVPSFWSQKARISRQTRANRTWLTTDPEKSKGKSERREGGNSIIGEWLCMFGSAIRNRLGKKVKLKAGNELKSIDLKDEVFSWITVNNVIDHCGEEGEKRNRNRRRNVHREQVYMYIFYRNDSYSLKTLKFPCVCVCVTN